MIIVPARSVRWTRRARRLARLAGQVLAVGLLACGLYVLGLLAGILWLLYGP